MNDREHDLVKSLVEFTSEGKREGGRDRGSTISREGLTTALTKWRGQAYAGLRTASLAHAHLKKKFYG